MLDRSYPSKLGQLDVLGWKHTSTCESVNHSGVKSLELVTTIIINLDSLLIDQVVTPGHSRA